MLPVAEAKPAPPAAPHTTAASAVVGAVVAIVVADVVKAVVGAVICVLKGCRFRKNVMGLPPIADAPHKAAILHLSYVAIHR